MNASPPDRVARLLDSFVPAGIRAEGGEEVVRARTAFGLSLVAAAVFVVLALLRIASGHYRVALADLGLATYMGAFPVLVKRSGLLRPFVNGALALAYLGFVGIAVFLLGGGLNLPALGLGIVPILSVLLLGMRAGLAWLVLTWAGSAFLGVLTARGVIPHGQVESVLTEHVTTAVIATLLYSVGGLYEYRRSLTAEQLVELEQRRHRAESERREALAEAKLSEAERLATLGEIAAMAAHEINNPLSYVAANLEHLERTFARSVPEARDALADARDGVQRIQKIVEDLQTYGRPERDDVTVADVRAAVESALKTVAGHTRPRARVTTEFGDVPAVQASHGRLVQVLVNLLVNAAEAIPEGRADDNEIRVVVRQEGPHVVIEIHDTGEGIPPDVLDRVKETFFTTKLGRGSGLGLALSERILQRVGGDLSLRNGPRGAVARVQLLAVVSGGAAPPAPPSPPSAGPLERMKLLLVDDEPLVLRALARNLGEHEIHTAESGRSAVRILGEGAPFDAVLCDVMMPDLTGADVFEFVKVHRPELVHRLIFMTGGTFSERMNTFRETAGARFLQKPVSLAELRSALEEVRPRRPS